MGEAGPEGTNWREDPDKVATVREGVVGIKETVTESPLHEKVELLRTSIDNIRGEVGNWPSERQGEHLSVIEDLQRQVREVQGEWRTLSASMKAQIERLDALLAAFPGVVEVSTLRALSLRLSQLEMLVSEHIGETRARTSAERAGKQLVISIGALGVTVVLWGVWIALMAFR